MAFDCFLLRAHMCNLVSAVDGDPWRREVVPATNHGTVRGFSQVSAHASPPETDDVSPEINNVLGRQQHSDESSICTIERLIGRHKWL